MDKVKKVFKREFATRKNEITSYINAISKRGKFPKNKFIIFAHYRTGSSLLSSLLNSHPDITCERELFLQFIYLKYKKVLFPNLIIRDRLINCKTNTYGFILRLDQLEKILLRFDGVPKDFLRNLSDNGWKIIHLKRKNYLKQSISNITSKIRGQSHDTFEKPLDKTTVYIDPNRLINTISWMERTAAKEDIILNEFAHLKIIYEDDLLHSDSHQNTMNKIFDYLELNKASVETTFKRTSTENIG
ncbi:MAG: hypothetical protein ACRENO_02400, partial [Thermodesulfobacteriota bacterium]